MIKFVGDEIWTVVAKKPEPVLEFASCLRSRVAAKVRIIFQKSLIQFNKTINEVEFELSWNLFLVEH